MSEEERAEMREKIRLEKEEARRKFLEEKEAQRLEMRKQIELEKIRRKEEKERVCINKSLYTAFVQYIPMSQ